MYISRLDGVRVHDVHIQYSWEENPLRYDGGGNPVSIT